MPKISLDNAYRYALCFLAFALSFPYYIFPVALVLLIITGLSLRITRKNWRFHKTLTLLYGLIFAYFLIRLIGDENVYYGVKVLGRNVSLLAIPLLFIPGKLAGEKAFFKSFSLGIAAAGFITLGGLAYDQLSGAAQQLEYYYDSFYTYGFHPTYMSMYAMAGIVMITYKPLFSKCWSTFLKIFLSLFIIISASRIVMITLLLFSIYRVFFGKDRFFGYVLATAGVLLISLYSFSPSFRLKINELKNFKGFTHYNNDNYGSVSVRVAKTQASFYAWKKNKWFGTGTGDYLDALETQYRSAKIQCWPCAKMRYNSHNQYLNTLVQLGIVGFLLFLGLGVCDALYARKYRSPILLGLIFVFAMVSLTESILERHAGIYIVFIFLYYIPLANRSLHEK